MMKKFSSIIVCLITLFLIYPAQLYAENKPSNTTPIGSVLRNLLKGRALVINLDPNTPINSETVLSGEDLLLVKLVPVASKAKFAPLQFTLISLTTYADFAKLDANHDGILDKAELIQAHVALLRYNPSGEIILRSIARVPIKKFSYQKGKDGNAIVNFYNEKDKKFTGYDLDL